MRNMDWQNIIMLALGTLLLWRAGGVASSEMGTTILGMGCTIIGCALGISVPNVIAHAFRQKIDETHERRHTPQGGTKNV